MAPGSLIRESLLFPRAQVGVSRAIAQLLPPPIIVSYSRPFSCYTAYRTEVVGCRVVPCRTRPSHGLLGRSVPPKPTTYSSSQASTTATFWSDQARVRLGISFWQFGTWLSHTIARRTLPPLSDRRFVFCRVDGKVRNFKILRTSANFYYMTEGIEYPALELLVNTAIEYGQIDLVAC